MRYSEDRRIGAQAIRESGHCSPCREVIWNDRRRVPMANKWMMLLDGAVLETWALRSEEIVTDELPKDSAFLAYRTAIQRDRADVLRPVADSPVVRTEAEAEM